MLFSMCERAVPNKSCDLNGSGSERYSPTREGIRCVVSRRDDLAPTLKKRSPLFQISFPSLNLVSACKPASKLARQPASRLVSQLVSQSVPLSVSQPVIQSACKPVSNLTRQPASRLVSQLVSQPVGQSVPLSVNQPCSQPANQSFSQSSYCST